MRRLTHILLAIAILLAPVPLAAQATRIQSSGTLPAACTVGNIYLKTGGSPGFYICLATNTWTGPLSTTSGTVTTTGSPANGNLATFSGASTVTNADLTGDVTTSGGVATTIANDAVTYAKLQDASATARILCRKTGGAGDFEECTLSEVLDLVGSAAQGDIFYRDGSGWTRLAAGTNGHFLQTQGAGSNPQWASAAAAAGSRSFGITIDGAGSAITTGVKGFVLIPTSGTITKATLLSTDAGATACDVVVDVWLDSYANFAPTDADSITASAPPTLSSEAKSQDSTLSGWTTSVTAGDIVGFHVDSVMGCTRVTLIIEVS